MVQAAAAAAGGATGSVACSKEEEIVLVFWKVYQQIIICISNNLTNFVINCSANVGKHNFVKSKIFSLKLC